MSDQDAFERILASLYEAMLDDALWPATSALIDEACGMVGNTLVIDEGPPDDVQTQFVGLYYRGQRREDWEREYMENYYSIDEHVPRFRQLPENRVVHITDLYTEQELKTSPVYNEAFLRGSAQDSLMVRLGVGDDSFISWSPLDPVTRGGWAAPQLALIKRLLPHIRQFVRVRRALISAEARGVSETTLLDNTRVGVIQLDQRGRIVEANDRARAILRHGDALTDRDGELRARQPTDHARLERLVAGALPTAGAPAVSGSMTLHRASVLFPLVVHVKPVSVRQPDFGTPRVAALMLIVEPGRQSRLDLSLVSETLGLTPAESQVAIWLAQGQTVREIAVATGRTEAAIHYHLHQIYQKRGIARQADLIRLVLSLADLM